MQKIQKYTLLLVSVLALQSILQTIFYYLGWHLGWMTDVGSFVLSLGILILVLKRHGSCHGATHSVLVPRRDSVLSGARRRVTRDVVFLLLSVLVTIFILWTTITHATTESIRTPWPLLGSATLIALAISFLSLILVAWKSRSIICTAFASTLTIMSVTFITPLLYKLGFGFDGFLHRASENIILQTGTLDPHPAYYIGQYVFVTWLSRVTTIPLHFMDIWLVPLAALLIPFFLLLMDLPSSYKRVMLVTLPLLLPFTPLIVTTPQSFAYLLGFFALCTALGYRSNQLPLIVPLSLVAWSLVTHPLAGIPFLGAVIGILLMATGEASLHRETAGSEQGGDASPVARQLVYLAIIILTSATIPLLFFFTNGFSFHSYSILNTLYSILTPPIIHVSFWIDWSAFIDYLFPFMLILLAFFSHKNRQACFLLFLGLGMTVASLILKATGNFSFLIDYERSNYADRLLILAQLFLLIPALIGSTTIIHQWKRISIFPVAFCLIILAAWFSARAYFTFPRHDAAITGHAWSMGQADIDAVRWIEQNAQGKPYTVLANQSVSAAAIQEFGFKRYTDKNIFYYPIPTGGPLYQHFLEASSVNPQNEHATQQAIRQASQLGKSDLVYVVINNYWWDAENVNRWLSHITTDPVGVIRNGKIRIYEFDLSNPNIFF
ncbi:hypothetical protein EXS71_00245 [Candidatus Uhrbacteria bacterium]|nr:hypothetical protein [Candidatus Uhrbacteria bacterium]